MSRIQRFPPVNVGQLKVRLPLSGRTAGLLAAAMLDPSAESLQRVEQRLVDDAALALWAIGSMQSQLGAFPQSAAEFAAQVIDLAIPAFAQAPASTRVSSIDRARLRRVAVRSAAMSAMCMADGAPTDQDFELRLAAGLHNVRDWVPLSLPEPAGAQADELASAWYRTTFGDRVPIEAARVRFESIPFDSLPDSVRHVTRAAEAWWDDEELTMFPIDAVARQCVDFERRLEQEKLEALAEFAAGAGHEINNPLAVISGRAQLLLQDETDHDRRQDLAMIHAQARRVHEMIAGLMLFARPPQANRTPVEVGSLISEVIDAYSDNIPGDPQPRLCLPAEEAWVLADALLLKQSLGALLDNAREATPAGETPAICVSVEVGDSVRGRVVRIAVQDQGVGITVTARRHMFDPFYSGRQAGRGLGVGLSKCWRIVTSHGGQLEVASDGQRGAIISIELPAVDGTQASDPAH